MALNYAALKAEIQTDPTARGYAVPYAAGNDQLVADLLNAPSGASVARSLVPSWQLVNAIVPSEYAALGTAVRDYLRMVVAAGQVQLGGGEARTGLALIFGAGTATRANLIALADKPATRAEQLFGIDTTISAVDVAVARRA